MNTHTGAGRVGVIVVAAGSGSRLGAGIPKAFVPLAGEPLLGHALRGVLACPGLAQVVLVVPADAVDEASEITHAVCRGAGSDAGVTAPLVVPANDVDVVVVAGGAERGDSVAAGLAALGPQVSVVLVHDAARCLTPAGVFERVVEAVIGGAVAVVPGLAVVDTVKQVDEHGVVVGTPDRAALRAVQTPQGFRRDVLERAHADSSDATDDAGLVERLGLPVLVVDGDARAMKVTTPDDLDRATCLLAD